MTASHSQAEGSSRHARRIEEGGRRAPGCPQRRQQAARDYEPRYREEQVDPSPESEIDIEAGLGPPDPGEQVDPRMLDQHEDDRDPAQQLDIRDLPVAGGWRGRHDAAADRGEAED